MPIEPLEDFDRTHARFIAALYRRSGAERWAVEPSDFVTALHRSAKNRFSETHPAPTDVERYLDGLCLEDLALACACMRGEARAWERFVSEYRPILYAAARALTHEESKAREIADSLYADLYGLGAQSAARRSLLEYFHGRSRLSTWLRAVVSRRHVDAFRAESRLRSLDDRDPGDLAPVQGAAAEPPDPARMRYLDCLRKVLEAVLAALEPRDRLRLCSYHLRDLTLAETGRILGEHESTVSRRLERTRRWIRKQVDRKLRREEGLSDDQIRLCYEYALAEWPFELSPAGASSEARNVRSTVPLEGESS
jgi:RNA polymerase sigma-70 factor